MSGYSNSDYSIGGAEVSGTEFESGEVVLSEADVAADLGAIDVLAVPSVERPDGQPGITEQLAGAHLVEDGEVPAGAIPAGELRRRDVDAALAAEEDAPDIGELVLTDLANRAASGARRRRRPGSRFDPLREAYEQLLDAVESARRALYERDGA